MIISYRYALLPPVAGWGDVAEREIALQRDLWNRLVGIERAHRSGIERALRRDGTYMAAADALAALTARFDALVAERREQRRQARAKIATPQIDAAIAALSEERRAAQQTIKPLRRAAWTGAAETVASLRNERYAAITEARQQSGLWWSNSNAVIASFDATLRRIEPWQMVREAEDGDTGRLSVQIQRGCPVPAFLVGARSEARIELTDAPARRDHRHGRLVATVHSDGRGSRQTATWPIILHRPLPQGGVVKSLTISRRRNRRWPATPDDHRIWDWSVSLSVEIPDATAEAGEACGIDIGWRKVEAGLRIATIVGESGGVEHVVLPRDWLAARLALAEAQGDLRRMLDDAVLPAGVPPELRGEPRKLADAWGRVSHSRPGAGDDWLDEQHNHRSRLARLERQRLDFYRHAAAAIMRRYRLIGIDGGGLAHIASDRTLPPEARRMRQWSAPHEFVQSLRNAARREGRVFREISGASTLICHRCGHRNNVPESGRADLVWRCQGCRNVWDQDENAARNVLCAALDASAAAVLMPDSQKPARIRPPRMTRKGNRSKTAPQSIDDKRPET